METTVGVGSTYGRFFRAIIASGNVLLEKFWQTQSEKAQVVTRLVGFFDELGLQLHCAEAVDFAIDVVVAFHQTDVFDFGAHFEDGGRPFDFEVFDDRDGIAVAQFVAIGVFDYFDLVEVFGHGNGGPFVPALWADQEHAVFVCVFGLAFWAIR